MNKSLIIQSDNTIMLQTSDPMFDKVKDDLIQFSEINQSPDSMYVYEITALSIWNAIAIGITREHIFKTLNENSKFPVPLSVVDHINKWYDTYGVVDLEAHDEEHFFLRVTDLKIINDLKANGIIAPLLCKEIEYGFLIRYNHRGEIKSALMKNNISVHDKIGYTSGETLNFKIRKTHLTEGFDIKIRYYQEESCSAVHSAGNGTVVLPCGAGKTMVEELPSSAMFANVCK